MKAFQFIPYTFKYTSLKHLRYINMLHWSWSFFTSCVFWACHERLTDCPMNKGVQNIVELSDYPLLTLFPNHTLPPTHLQKTNYSGKNKTHCRRSNSG